LAHDAQSPARLQREADLVDGPHVAFARLVMHLQVTYDQSSHDATLPLAAATVEDVVQRVADEYEGHGQNGESQARRQNPPPRELRERAERLGVLQHAAPRG